MRYFRGLLEKEKPPSVAVNAVKEQENEVELAPPPNEKIYLTSHPTEKPRRVASLQLKVKGPIDEAYSDAYYVDDLSIDSGASPSAIEIMMGNLAENSNDNTLVQIKRAVNSAPNYYRPKKLFQTLGIKDKEPNKDQKVQIDDKVLEAQQQKCRDTRFFLLVILAALIIGAVIGFVIVLKRKDSAEFVEIPTFRPTRFPTSFPTQSPTTSHPTTNSPTREPTHFPSKDPTATPTISPTIFPTVSPSKNPTRFPTSGPVTSPGGTPFPTTSSPTAFPTTAAPSPFPTTAVPTTTAPTPFPTT